MNIIGIDKNQMILMVQTNAPADSASALVGLNGISQIVEVSDAEAGHLLSSKLSAFYWGGTQAVELPAPPGSAYTWDWPSKTWMMNLTAGQSAAWARIKAARDAAIAAGVTYNGNVYDSDATAQLRVTGAATMAQLAIASGNTAYSITWTLANNSIVTLTAQEVIAMAQAVGTNYQASFSKAQGLRGQITAATTQAQLDAVVW